MTDYHKTEAYYKELLDSSSSLIVGLENKSIGATRGIIQAGIGQYEEVLYKKSAYARETMATGGGVRWRYTLNFGDSVTQGFSQTLRGARLNALKILKSKLERNGK